MVEVPAPAKTWVSDAAADRLLVVMAEPARCTYTWRLAGRWAGLAQVGAQRLPDIGGEWRPVLAGRLASQDDPPGAPIEVVQLQPRRLVSIGGPSVRPA